MALQSRLLARWVAPVLVSGTLACAGAPPLVEVNDNRLPAGIITRDSLREIRLEATLAQWKPDDGADSLTTVQAFAERDGVPRIPGPLVRVAEGERVRVTVVNTIPDSTLRLHGIPTNDPMDGDSIIVESGDSRMVEFTAGTPGTYIYWGSTTGTSFGDRVGYDAQLTGAFVVDAAGVEPDTSERIFVITVLDILPDTTKPLDGQNDLFDLAVNGKSWPSTEPLDYVVGDTVRWRWINGSYLSHPMHLHGFHFKRTAKGNGITETLETENPQEVVTELMRIRSTFRMEFVPTRAGNWLFHCHMADHVRPFPDRPDSTREHGAHDVAAHATTSMSGLVLGVRVKPRAGEASPAVDETVPAVRHRLLAQQAKADSGKNKRPARGFVLQRGGEPRADSIEIPGTPLFLTRGERVGIRVVNKLTQPTTVHWHGMELESYYDGVSGWSGADSRRAPLVAPGDSFAVTFTPPRAGTYIYHTHMEEEPQMQYGLFGPMIVLEPGERFDAAKDLIITLGNAAADDNPFPVVNGRREWSAPAFELRARSTYRIRLINILATIPMMVTLQSANDTTPLTWRAHAKDGADLAPARRAEMPSRLTFGVGETYDFMFTPRRAGDLVLMVRSAGPEPGELRMPIRVR